MRRRFLSAAPLWIACAVAVIGLAACGGANKVGDSNLLNIKNKVGGGFDVTTTTEVAATLPVQTTTAPRTTTVSVTTPRRTTTTISSAQKKAITAVIKVQGASTGAFTPSQQTVYPGTPVQWVNQDTQVRSVVSDDGTSFSSGPIPPGGSYTWTTKGSPRHIAYHDGTRPYAVAALDVVPAP